MRTIDPESFYIDQKDKQQQTDKQPEEPQDQDYEEMAKSQDQAVFAKQMEIEPNVEAAVSYLVPFLMGVVIILLEKENEYVKFHAKQSIIFGVVLFLYWSLMALLYNLMPSMIKFFSLLTIFINLGLFGVYSMLMFQAYNYKEWKIPIIYDLIEKNLKLKK